MLLSIATPTAVVKAGGSTAVAAGSLTLDDQAQVPDGAQAASGVSRGNESDGSGQGQVVDTLVDRLADLHEQLARLRQELRTALRSLQPDVVRLPRILSLQRQIMVANSDIQLVAGLLIGTLSKTAGTVNAQV